MTARPLSLALALLAAPVVAAAGCQAQTFTVADGAPTVSNTDDGGASLWQTAESGAGSSTGGGEPDAKAPAFQGSPLCAAQPPSDCYPDDPSTAKACDLAPDGGPYNATSGYDNAKLACRVQASPNSAAGVQPVCAPAGTAGDGSWCKSSEECAPTYDCVGAGTCQRYCCSGNSECLTAEFCDIQTTVATSSIEVPVCMPIHPAGGCTLLDPTSCCSGTAACAQTCAVVREDGATSCVAVGAAKAGESCDYDHCAAGLVCLGTPGQRLCFQLCHVGATSSSNECSASPQQSCKGGLPLFPDPTIGICQ
jgi:hypothetical protein